jgi:hypothetical protein
MKIKVNYTPADRAYNEATAAVRRAVRAGDIVKAERWLKLAERYWKIGEIVEAAQQQRAARRRAHRAAP